MGSDGAEDVQHARIRALDGLRGVAALVVVTQHILISTTPWYRSFTWDPTGDLVTLFSVTPLRLLWAGSEAVWIFFVLSGFVLTRRALAGAPVHAGRYLVRRTVRIHLPALAAILASLALAALPRNAHPAGSPWLADHLDPATAAQTIITMTLVLGNKLEHVNGALWTLQWEMVFSYVVPVVIVVALALRRSAVAWGTVCVLVSSFGSQLVDDTWTPALVQATRYLPMFGLGVALACHEARLAAWSGRLDRGSGHLTVAIALVALSVRYPLVQYEPLGTDWSAALGRLASLTAAGALIVLALVHEPLTRALERPAVQWVGLRSFSLYLIHEPVLMAMAFGTGLLGTDPLRMAALYACVLVAAAAFYRIVEAPTLRLGRRLAARPKANAADAPSP